MSYRVQVKIHDEFRWFAVRDREAEELESGNLEVRVGSISYVFAAGAWYRMDDTPLSKPQRKRIRAQLIRRDGLLCAVCSGEMDHTSGITIDHKKPRALGGTNDLSNLQLAHKRCNEIKADRYAGRNTSRDLGLWIALLGRMGSHGL